MTDCQNGVVNIHSLAVGKVDPVSGPEWFHPARLGGMVFHRKTVAAAIAQLLVHPFQVPAV